MYTNAVDDNESKEQCAFPEHRDPKMGKGHGVLKSNWFLSRNVCSELE